MKKFLRYISIGLIAVMIGAVAIADTFNQGEDQLLIDGDMEKSGVTDWTASGATLTKETGTIYDGVQILRITKTGAGTALASQAILTIGETYRATGWARSDGTATPTLRNPSGVNIWTGTTSTSWQYFDFSFTASGDTSIYLTAQGGVATDYTEFDNVLVTEYIPPVKDAEDQILNDGDMEDDDGSPTSEWTAGNSAVLTKQTDKVYDGKQILRVAYGGNSQPVAFQSVKTIGERYRSNGWTRSDGTNVPIVRDGGIIIWTGTSSTDWQYFDVIHTAASVQIQFGAVSVTSGHTEWNDIFVTEYTPPNKNFYKQIVADGDMEASGTTDWIEIRNPNLTKETGGAENGDQFLRVAYIDTATPTARQVILTVDTRYRITGWFRGDGTFQASVSDGTTRATSTSSTDWQYFDVTNSAPTTSLSLQCSANASGHCDFDNIFVTAL
jgi:hypothetical protein